MSPEREALIAECRRIEEYSKWNAASHFTASTWLGRFHLVMGCVPIVLGAIGSWNGFEHLKSMTEQTQSATERTVLWCSVAVLISGLVGSIMSFWKPAAARGRHHKAATRYKTLENQARRAAALCQHEPDERFRRRVGELASRYDELNETSAQSSDFAFWLATGKVRSGKYDPDKPEP